MPLHEISSPYVEGEKPCDITSRLIVEKTCTNTNQIVSEANSTWRNRLSSRTTRSVSPKAFPARMPRTPAGKANHATTPYKIEVAASPTNNQRKDFCASNPAVAGPKAQPALKDIRYAANAVTRCPAGTKSASKALLAGR